MLSRIPDDKLVKYRLNIEELLGKDVVTLKELQCVIGQRHEMDHKNRKRDDLRQQLGKRSDRHFQACCQLLCTEAC